MLCHGFFGFDNCLVWKSGDMSDELFVLWRLILFYLEQCSEWRRVEHCTQFQTKNVVKSFAQSPCSVSVWDFLRMLNCPSFGYNQIWNVLPTVAIPNHSAVILLQDFWEVCDLMFVQHLYSFSSIHACVAVFHAVLSAYLFYRYSLVLSAYLFYRIWIAILLLGRDFLYFLFRYLLHSYSDFLEFNTGLIYFCLDIYSVSIKISTQIQFGYIFCWCSDTYFIS